MALLFLESFDHYAGSSPAEQITKWTNRTGTWVVDPIYAQDGLNGAFCSSGSLGKANIGGSNTLIVGFAMKLGSTGGSVRSAAILGLINSTGTQHVRIGIDLDTQALSAGLGSSATNFGIVPLFAIGDLTQWHYYEIKVTVANAGGLVQFYVDGVLHGTFTGDTQNGSTPELRQVLLECSGAALWTDQTYDNIYIADDTGAVINDFIGPCRVDCRMPEANGNYSQWVNTAATSVNNYSYVDEPDPDGDTSYVQSGVNGDKDSYGFQALGLAPGETVLGLQTIEYGRKTDIDAKQVRTFSRIAGVDYPNSDQPLAETYGYGLDVLEVSPATAVAWTEAEIDAAEFGIEVRA